MEKVACPVNDIRTTDGFFQRGWDGGLGPELMAVYLEGDTNDADELQALVMATRHVGRFTALFGSPPLAPPQTLESVATYVALLPPARSTTLCSNKYENFL